VKLYSEVLGKSVEVPDRPERIVSLAPAITETLYMLGLEERVVGVSFFCDKPPQVSKKPRVGAYLNVNYSLLEKLRPDLVLVTTGAQRERIAELESKGYVVYPIPLPVSVYGILDGIIVVGMVVGEVDKARQLASSLLDRLMDLRGTLKGVKLYYEIDLGGPVSVGAYSYIGDAFKLMGASHVFEGQRIPYVINPSPEAVKAFDPDVIIYEQKLGEKASIESVRRSLEARGMGSLRALREGKVVIMEYDSLAHYGPSFFEAAKTMAERVKAVLGASRAEAA
jgi:ABC-type Fe3+-hydroxamate transport system, periplasmic component